MSKTNTFGCTLDQSRDISHNESLCSIQINNTEIRIQCCEMIVRNFRFRICNTGKQCRFTNVRETNQTYICDHLQFQIHFQLSCRLSWLCILRNLHGRSSKMLISKSASSAF